MTKPQFLHTKEFEQVVAIKRIVAAHFGYDLAKINSTDRSEPLVTHRQLAMYLARKLTNTNFTDIAEAFGKKHHGTVIHAVATIEQLAGERPQLKRDIALLAKKINLALTQTDKFQPEKA